MDRRIARSTKALKKALVELLEEKTIDEISVTEITERAGYTRKTFYSRYEDKSAFITAIIDDEAVEIMRVSELVLPEEDNAVQIEEQRILADAKSFEHVLTNKELYRAIIRNKLAGNALHLLTKKIKEKSYDLYSGIIADQLYDMPYAKSPIDWDIVFYIKAALIVNLISYWDEVDYKYSPSYMAEQKSNANGKLIIKKYDLLRKADNVKKQRRNKK